MMRKLLLCLILGGLGIPSLFSQSLDWAIQLGNTGSDGGQQVAVDASGNVFIAGYFSNTVNFNPLSISPTNRTSTGGEDIFIAKYDAAGLLAWVRWGGSTGDDRPHGIGLNAAGDVYVTGTVSGTSNFFPFGSPPAPTPTNFTGKGGTDIFIIKYDGNGNFRWVVGVGGAADDGGFDLVVDEADQPYVTGGFQGVAIDFNPKGAASPLTSFGAEDVFLARYDASGNLLGAINMGGTLDDRGLGIDRDDNNQVFVAGYYQGVADFDPGVATTATASLGGTDGFLASYTTAGAYQWHQSIGQTLNDACEQVLIDSSDAILLTGNFQGLNADFGGTLLSSAGGADIFLAKYNNAGPLQWAFQLGNTGNESGKHLATDACENIYLSGFFSGSVDFDPAAGTSTLSAPSPVGAGYFVGKYAPGGNFTWAGGGAATGNSQGLGMELDVAGNLYATGDFDTQIDADLGSSASTLTAFGGSDAFFSRHGQSEILVTNTNDSGIGSLRDAIIRSNTQTGADTIRFCLSGAGPFVIQPLSALPDINDNGTVLDATSQTGYTLGLIQLNGMVAGGIGLNILNADNCEVWGLDIQQFTNAITANNSDNFVIGGNGLGNLINNNTAAGILILASQNGTIQGNFIGTDISATSDEGNGGEGIYIVSGNGHSIGGTGAGEPNVIAFNTYGVRVGSNFNLIRQNSFFCNSTAGIFTGGTGNSGIGVPNITTPDPAAINGTANPGEQIEVYYHDDTGCIGAPCQGKTYLGTTTTTGAGTWSLSGTYTLGAEVAAIAIDGSGNTSPFSLCATVDALLDAEPVQLTLRTEATGSFVLSWNQSAVKEATAYEVQRASEQSGFETLTRISPLTQGQLMKFHDKQPKAGWNAYRLRQIFLDGSFSYSNRVEGFFAQSGLRLYPNPSQAVIHLTFAHQGPQTRLEIVDLNGRSLLIQENPPAELVLQVADWTRGLYLLRWSDGLGQLFQQKFVLE